MVTICSIAAQTSTTGGTYQGRIVTANTAEEPRASLLLM
jgi:hypothetical protein